MSLICMTSSAVIPTIFVCASRLGMAASQDGKWLRDGSCPDSFFHMWKDILLATLIELAY